jgi:hypothetical protein
VRAAQGSVVAVARRRVVEVVLEVRVVVRVCGVREVMVMVVTLVARMVVVRMEDRVVVSVFVEWMVEEGAFAVWVTRCVVLPQSDVEIIKHAWGRLVDASRMRNREQLTADVVDWIVSLHQTDGRGDAFRVFIIWNRSSGCLGSVVMLLVAERQLIIPSRLTLCQ